MPQPSQSRISELQLDRDKVRQDVKDLRKQIEELRNEISRKAVDGVSISREIELEIEREVALSKAGNCLDLASMILGKLPRELRDRVYAQGCVEDRPIMVLMYGKRGKKSRDSADAYAQHPLQIMEERHLPNNRILDINVVGKTLAHEAAQAYYSQNVFHLYDLRSLRRFLCSSHFEPDFDHRKTVRNLEVEIDWKYMDEDGHLQSRWKRLNRIFSALQANVELMRDIPRLNIELRLCTRLRTYALFVDERVEAFTAVHGLRFLNILEAVRKPVYDLKCAASKVTILHKEHGKEQRNIDHLFRLTAAEWKTEKGQSAADSVDWIPETYYLHQPNSLELRNAVNTAVAARWGGFRLLDDLMPEGAEIYNGIFVIDD